MIYCIGFLVIIISLVFGISGYGCETYGEWLEREKKRENVKTRRQGR